MTGVSWGAPWKLVMVMVSGNWEIPPLSLVFCSASPSSLTYVLSHVQLVACPSYRMAIEHLPSLFLFCFEPGQNLISSNFYVKCLRSLFEAGPS